MNIIRFNPRWKEELVAYSKEGTLIFEFTMGVDHVYFPDKEKWENDAPAWAKNKWEEYRESCELWCKNNRVPMTITGNTFMYEEK